MTTEQLVGCIATVGMLSLVVPSLVNRGMPARKLAKMALIWVAIFIVAIAFAIGVSTLRIFASGLIEH